MEPSAAAAPAVIADRPRRRAGDTPKPRSAWAPDLIPLEQWTHETSKHLRSLGVVNILVAGQTGVGKSTLINGVFSEEFARAAAGTPVTQYAEWHTSSTVPLRILDTRGLEAKDYAETLNAVRSEIERSRAQPDERQQLHLGWVCIAAPSSRVQDCEVDIVRLLNKFDIPAIIVLTKDDDDEEFATTVGSIMAGRGVRLAGIVRVRARATQSRAAQSQATQSRATGARAVHGLDTLVASTLTNLPQAHRAAFAAAQRVNRQLSRSTAEDYVTAAASAAAAASIIPIPFADLATLAPIQAAMLLGVSSAFGLTIERSQISQMVATVIGCLAVTVVGGWAIGNALKFIPGPGSVIGAVVNATVAGTVTRTLGRAYIWFFYTFSETHGRLPTTDEIVNIFPSYFKSVKALPRLASGGRLDSPA